MNQVAEKNLMVSIVIPAYNEEPFIAETVRKCQAVMQEKVGWVRAFEIIVVDDGCNDDTANLAQSAGARIIKHHHNRGYGRSLKDGVQAAQYDTIIITDGDGTYPLEALPALLRTHGNGFNMVVGSRRGEHLNETVFKKLLRFILKILVELCTGRRIPDINSGFRVFSRREIKPYLPRLCDTFSFTTSLTLAYLMTGKIVGYIPIAYHARIGESKIRILNDSFRTLQYIVEAILFYNPIILFVILTVLFWAAAIVNFAIAILFRVADLYMLAVGSLLMGGVMLALGFIAVLLKQIIIARKTL